MLAVGVGSLVMRVLVCGGREFYDLKFVHATLDMIHAKTPIAVVIEGGARGADDLAHSWAERNNVALATFVADWKLYGKRAGPIRNELMLREGKPDLVVAFPGGDGTANMVRLAERALVPLIRPPPP